MEITKDEWRAKRETLRAEIKAPEAETAEPVNPIELLTLGKQWQSGDVEQRAAVLNALWERIEIRKDKVVKVVKLTPRADRASRAHALISTALQYIKNGEFDESDVDDGPRDGGPGADLRRTVEGRGWMGIEPTQDASAAPRKRF